MRQTATITVMGRPIPKGSMLAFKHAKTSKAVIVPDNEKLPEWEALVAAEALVVWKKLGYTVSRGPVSVDLKVFRKRPAKHFGTGRNAGRLRPDAPDYPMTVNTGDIDKLKRAIHDALEGICYVNDSQVVESCGYKLWGDEDWIEIVVDTDWDGEDDGL